MRSIMAWIRSNPVALISMIVVVLALAVLFVIPMRWGGALKQRVGERDREYNEVNRFMSQVVNMPPEHPDDPPKSYSNIAINQAAIDTLVAVNEEINQQYRDTFAVAVARNIGQDIEPTTANTGSPARRFMMPGLFPLPEDIDVRFRARQAYRQAFAQMLGAPSPDADGPRVNAGPPLSPEQMSMAVNAARQEFMQAQSVTGGGTMTEEDQTERHKQEQTRLAEVLREYADTIHLYVGATSEQVPGFPFQIGAWAESGDFPTPAQIWEGQLELWIQQDIARVIALANNVDGSKTRLLEDETGQMAEQVYPSSVVDAPVKRLMGIYVVPGYVGFHTLGGVGAGASNTASGVQRADGSYDAPIGGMTGSPDQRQSDNFYVGPSGRVSNAVYDVRHAVVNMVVDYQQLPMFFEALSQVSFMTALDVQIRDVDEYAALAEGYFYGRGDVVEVTMVIETIWLRDWTVPLMPEQTKQYLGLAEYVGEGAGGPDESGGFQNWGGGGIGGRPGAAP